MKSVRGRLGGREGSLELTAAGIERNAIGKVSEFCETKAFVVPIRSHQVISSLHSLPVSRSAIDLANDCPF